MRILFLAPRYPLPADTGGKIRTWNLLKQASQSATVDLLCFSFDRNDVKNTGECRYGSFPTIGLGGDGSIFGGWGSQM